jgi:hypothetical protein
MVAPEKRRQVKGERTFDPAAAAPIIIAIFSFCGFLVLK